MLNNTQNSFLADTSDADSVTMLANSGKGNIWGPLIDGAVIPVQPSTIGVQVPSILGTNTQEGRLFLIGDYKAVESDYNSFLNSSFGPLADQIKATYPISNFATKPAAISSAAFLAMNAVFTEYIFLCPTYRALQNAVARGIDVYTYSFNHTPSCSWISGTSLSPAQINFLGPTHTSEIPFVFGLTENLPPPSGTCNFTTAENGISAFMLGAWTSMAATAQPGGSPKWPKWPKWTNGTGAGAGEGVLVNAGVSIGVVDYSSCDFWDSIDATIAAIAANKTTSSTPTGSPTASGAPSSSPTKSPAGKLELCSTSALVLLLGLIHIFI